MATLRIILNGIPLHPLLPIEREVVPIASDKRSEVNGVLRRAWRRTIQRITLRAEGLSEAQLEAWEQASLTSQSLSYTDELNLTRQVIVTGRRVTLSSTTPPSGYTGPDDPAATALTGPAEYDIELTLEEL